MLLLALDSSTRQASIALCTEDELLGEYTWHVGNNHSVELLERIQRITAECNKTMQDIDVIAVATGPGSFNGVRVALSAAKALAFALQKPIVGVSTLDIIAAQQQHWTGPICSILEAGRSELYAACYTLDKTHDSTGGIIYHMRQLSDYLLRSPQLLANYLREQANAWFGVPGKRELPFFLFCGEINPASRQALYAQMQEKCVFVSSVQAARRASVLATLALQRMRDGKEDNPMLLEPLYLRRPSITTSTRKQPLFGGTSNRPTGHSPTGPSETEREEGALRH
jgi:tRNA threonylcarbamoyladenosine biosynthesis protein TsaB